MELDVLGSEAPTEVGSYFIANYPPFSVWQREQVPQVLRLLEQALPDDGLEAHTTGHGPEAHTTGHGLEADTTGERRRPAGRHRLEARATVTPPLGLYLHIPFCRKRCKFCYFRVYTDKNAAEVEFYLDALAREVQHYARLPRLAGRPLEFVYFGGGTPSFLSSAQLERLVQRIDRAWRWDAAREVTFECEPGTLKREKLKTIRRIGVTRLSLGIEHFDDEVLAINGRAHRSREIFEAWGWARQAGFPQINIDLIAGLVGDSEPRWRATVEQALRLEPDSVTIYQMELPFNAVFSRELRDGALAGRVADWQTKRRWEDYAFAQFEQTGYVVSSGYTLLRSGRPQSFVYRDSLWRGADMIGTGVASFSHVAGMHFQNLDRWEDYLAACERGELPLARALAATAEQALIRELILQLKLGRLEASYFRETFGLESLDRFAGAFASLVDEGLAEVAHGRVRLTREGLLRVDALLPRFFEPRFRDIRYT
jgi:oxygen-independent coproporphyrinogen-3 oxidase